jgi:hypothetical protein
MIYGEKTLREALREHGLSSRPGPDIQPGRILVQRGRDVGQMTASTGWALVRLLDGQSTDDCRRCDVYDARVLLAGIDR